MCLKSLGPDLWRVNVSGQDQDTLGGGFNSRESYVGEMSQLNIYDEVLLPSVVADLANRTACNMAAAGNVVAWTDVLDHALGDVRVVNGSHCLGNYIYMYI